MCLSSLYAANIWWWWNVTNAINYKIIFDLWSTSESLGSQHQLEICEGLTNPHFMKKRNSSKFHFKFKTLPAKVEHLQNYLPILSLYQPLNNRKKFHELSISKNQLWLEIINYMSFQSRPALYNIKILYIY